MTIAEIVRNGKGTAGHGHSWEVTLGGKGQRYLTHHGHLMLIWHRAYNGRYIVTYADTGHGSVSDQGGMNKAFRELGAPYYYSRKGGAEIRETSK
jgi:hypothetical protein